MAEDKRAQQLIDALSSMENPQAIEALARDIVHAAYRGKIPSPHLLLRNEGDGEIQVEGHGVLPTTLGPREELKVVPTELRPPRASGHTSGAVFLSRALSLRIVGEKGARALLDARALPSNRPGALHFLIERRAESAESELCGVPPGEHVEIHFTERSEIQLCGMGYSLVTDLVEEVDEEHEEDEDEVSR
jgi:hypothetical protein